MSEQGGAPEWRVIGETVPGASHLRAGIPNQDAILQLRESGRGLPVVVSVSDGHGSDKCFRSHLGSRFAVRLGAQLATELLDELRGADDPSAAEEELKKRAPAELVRRWREAVEADWKARPFTSEELETLEKKDDARARKLVEENPLLAYGATSLTVAVSESFILYLQLGDGEILNISDAGAVERALPEDARLFANETTSLCTSGAERDFRFRLQRVGAERPALILLTTDGYANSFSDEAGFLKVGSDLLEMLRADGFDAINASVKGWLEEATQAGSGDDTTLAIVCRMDALAKHEPAPAPVPAKTPQVGPAAASASEPGPAPPEPQAGGQSA